MRLIDTRGIVLPDECGLDLNRAARSPMAGASAPSDHGFRSPRQQGNRRHGSS